MQEGRHSREAKLADEDGGVETGIALLRLDRLAAFSVGPGECSQDYGNELSSAFKRSSREATLRTDGQDDLVTRMLLEVVVPRKCLPAKRTRLAVVQRAKQAPSTESLRRQNSRVSSRVFLSPSSPLVSVETSGTQERTMGGYARATHREQKISQEALSAPRSDLCLRLDPAPLPVATDPYPAQVRRRISAGTPVQPKTCQRSAPLPNTDVPPPSHGVEARSGPHASLHTPPT